MTQAELAEKLNITDRAMIETYNKKVDFINYSSLDQIINTIQK